MFDNINKYQIKSQSLLKSRIISLYNKNHLINNIPKIVSIESLDNKTILLTFNLPVSPIDLTVLKPEFNITGNEYNMIPEGTPEEVKYEIDTVDHYVYKTVKVVDISSGVLVNTEFFNGRIQLGIEE